MIEDSVGLVDFFSKFSLPPFSESDSEEEELEDEEEPFLLLEFFDSESLLFKSNL